MFSAYFTGILRDRRVGKSLTFSRFCLFLGFFKKTKEKKDRVSTVSAVTFPRFASSLRPCVCHRSQPREGQRRADFREGDGDSNFSVERVWRFSEWPEPLH